jgi:hypothetical protein
MSRAMMRRALIRAVIALVLGGGATAMAETPPAPTPTPGGPTLDDDVDQMVGGLVGIAAGGRTTPGGLVLGGSHLYRLSDLDWLQSSVSFTLGGGGAACFRDRDDQRICDHEALDGFAGELGVGVRHQLTTHARMTPFFALGVAVRVVSYPDDDMIGIAFPLVGGGGVRARVAPHVQVVGGGELRAGYAHYGDGIDGEPQISLTVFGGLEFELH